MATFRLVVVAVVASAVLGCGGGPQMAEVEGTVKRKGKVLDRVIVEFWPEANGPRSIGTTDENGRFVLTSDDGKRPGALVGKHRVVLHDGSGVKKFLGRAADGHVEPGFKPRFSSDYGDPLKTKLTRDVAGGKNVIDLEVDPL